MGKRRILPALLSVFLLLAFRCAAAEQERRVYVFINGEYIEFDQQPFLKNDVTLVPARAIFELLGARVEWQGRAAVAYTDECTLTLWAGSPYLYKNGERIPLGAASEIVGDRMMVPVRAVSEAFGCTVAWDGERGKVSILTTDSGQYNAALEKEVFELVNSIRKQNGLKPFLWDDDLKQVARQHSKDMFSTGFLDHNGSDGRSPFERMRNYGISYSYAAENIAAYYDRAGAVVDGWMRSEEHRANIMNGNLGRMGVGYYGGYWTQDFAD